MYGNNLTLRDGWYRPNLLYNIHWRSPFRHESGDFPTTAVVIKRFNPSRCTCHDNSPTIQYRMDTEIIHFTDEYEKLRKLDKIHTAFPDEEVKLKISAMETIHKPITTITELTDTIVNNRLYVQGVKDLIGLFKAKRKSNVVDDLYVGIKDTEVDEQGDIDQSNVTHKECSMCIDRKEHCNIRDLTHNVLTDDQTSQEDTDDSCDADGDTDDEVVLIYTQ